MTAAKAAQREITTLGRAVHFQRLDGVARTRGLKAAGGTQPRAQKKTIAFNDADEAVLEQIHDGNRKGSSNASSSARTARLSRSELALTNKSLANGALSRTAYAAGTRGNSVVMA